MAEGDDLRNLLQHPREALDLELKEWFDPTQPEGKAKIAKGCLAMRNHDGGRLVIGFTNQGLPAPGAPPDVREAFHGDVVQGIVSDYAADPFAVDVTYVEVNGQDYPVITVLSGVRTPVAAKADLKDPSDPTGKKFLVQDHTIYVRSLNSNGVVSSTRACKNDWAELTTRCFNNREADIGGFVRRHLAALDLGALTALVPVLAGVQRRPDARERAVEELTRGRLRFDDAVVRRPVTPPDAGFREAVIIVDGEFPAQTTSTSFLNQLLGSAPNYLGRPPWDYLHHHPSGGGRPNVVASGWESLIEQDAGHFPARFDFSRLEPGGVFYSLRALEDDLPGPYRPPPRTLLDFYNQTAATAEVIAIGLAFGRTLGAGPEKTTIHFGFRWSRLRGRRLACWVDPSRLYGPARVAEDDEYVGVATVPMDTPPAAIAPHVEGVVKGLFLLFEGEEFDSRVIHDIVTQTLERR